jgi:DUF3039 family protein
MPDPGSQVRVYMRRPGAAYTARGRSGETAYTGDAEGSGSPHRQGPSRGRSGAWTPRRTGSGQGDGAYAGPVAMTGGSTEPEAAGGTTLAPARPAPDLDEGDHDRMAHIVLEGYTPKDGDFVSTGPSVVEGIVTGTAVRALCGKEWVPGRNPGRYGLCPTCKEIAEAMGWQIPTS